MSRKYKLVMFDGQTHVKVGCCLVLLIRCTGNTEVRGILILKQFGYTLSEMII